MLLLFPMSSVTTGYDVYPCSSTCVSVVQMGGLGAEAAVPVLSKVLPGKHKRLWDIVSW